MSLKKVLVFPLIVTFCCASRTADSRIQRRNLIQPTQVQGYSCAPGPAWFYADGRLHSCTLAAEAHFGEADAPERSWIRLTPTGEPEFLVVSRDTQISGVVCRGGRSAEGYTTAFYPSGRLKGCWLAGDQNVQGIPCMGATFLRSAFRRDVCAIFYEDGRLKSCRLSGKYGPQSRGDAFKQ